MSHTMKLWERIIEARLRDRVEISKEQYGFMPGKGTTDAMFHLFFFIFISIFILLTRRKATEALIHRIGNYPDLLPEIPRYCYPLVIYCNRDMTVI